MALSRLLLVPALAFVLMGATCQGPIGKALTPDACPPLYTYSKAFLAETAREAESIMASHPHVMKMLRDYGVTRDFIRACLK
jgi:hypothetical protein